MKKTKLITINVTPGGCHECTSHMFNKDGYPVICINKKIIGLHRYIFQQNNPGIVLSPETVIMHTCDNRKCINPAHLVAGTHSDNVNDRVNKKRSALGEHNGRSKLKKEDVVKIFYSKLSQSELAKFFGVDKKLIREIKKRRIWKSVTDFLPAVVV